MFENMNRKQIRTFVRNLMLSQSYGKRNAKGAFGNSNPLMLSKKCRLKKAKENH